MLSAPDNLPSAPACERNREPIWQVLLPYFLNESAAIRNVLEIGSGTGQHAWYFTQRFAEEANTAQSLPGDTAHNAAFSEARALKNLQWQCSDVADNLALIEAWREASGQKTFLPPIELDLVKGEWPDQQYDYIYTANTLHIVSWPLVLAFCDCVVNTLIDGGKLFIYGPFNYGGSFTSDSNAAFDASLRTRDPLSGIRDFEALCQTLVAAADSAGFVMSILKDIAMPANNRLLVFEKQAVSR